MGVPSNQRESSGNIQDISELAGHGSQNAHHGTTKWCCLDVWVWSQPGVKHQVWISLALHRITVGYKEPPQFNEWVGSHIYKNGCPRFSLLYIYTPDYVACGSSQEVESVFHSWLQTGPVTRFGQWDVKEPMCTSSKRDGLEGFAHIPWPSKK